MKEGFVSLTFDDGWKSAIENAHPLLQRFRMPATFYVVSDYVTNKLPGYMTQDDLLTLARDGHEIGSHTKSHRHLPELSDAVLWEEIQKGAGDLRALGFDSCTFAYPFGDWNPAVVKQVREAGFLAARTIVRGLNDDHTNHLLLRGHGVKNEHSAEDVCAWISQAMQSRNWIILFFHQIESTEVLKERKWIYGTTPTILEEILAFLSREHISITTVADGIERLVAHAD